MHGGVAFLGVLAGAFALSSMQPVLQPMAAHLMLWKQWVPAHHRSPACLGKGVAAQPLTCHASMHIVAARASAHRVMECCLEKSSRSNGKWRSSPPSSKKQVGSPVMA